MKETKKEKTEAVQIVETDKGQLTHNDLFKLINNSKGSKSLNTEYLSLVEGEEIKCVFLGMTKITSTLDNGEDKLINACKLLLEDGKVYLSADKVLVTACLNLSEEGRFNVPLSITFLEKIKSARGFYKKMLIEEVII